MSLVSVVIPCFNPGEYLLEAIASARAQTWKALEVVLVNDGTTAPSAISIIKRAIPLADRFVDQANLGLPAARNSGFSVAAGEQIVPLDADDILNPECVSECQRALVSSPDAAFAFTDYRLFGLENFIERPGAYNLYQLLDRNALTYSALIRRRDWELAGGYDEAMRRGYEDWEFWLRLGSLGRFGCHVPKVLFRYRKHGYSLLDVARAHHQDNIEYIRNKHAEMYSWEGRARIKAVWFPATRVIGPRDLSRQTLLDCLTLESAATPAATPSAFLFPSSSELDRNSAELGALAIWSGRKRVELPDGSVACSGDALVKTETSVNSNRPKSGSATSTRRFETLHRHLANAGLLSWQSWRQHPVRSLLRLIPLRVKERINETVGTQVFDLSFYLQFRPRSILADNRVAQPLAYMPRIGTRRRVALITPHLGTGGAEALLYDVAGYLDRDKFEVLLITVQSGDDRWRNRWSERVDHVYDLGRVVAAERLGATIYSIVTNWKHDFVLLQNALIAYSVAPRIREALPSVRIVDLIHSIDNDWNIAWATAGVAGAFSTRVAVSQTAANELKKAGTPPDRVRVVRAGVDGNRFRISDQPRREGPWRILFAARMEPVKRPLLLADVAAELMTIRRCPDFTVTVAGDGPELARLRRKVTHSGLDGQFKFLGHVAEMSPLIADADVVLLTSLNEGIPLIALEALACGKPVVSSSAGAVGEVVIHGKTGYLITRNHSEPTCFARAIHELLQSSACRDELGKAGRLLIEKDYSPEGARRAWNEIFS